MFPYKLILESLTTIPKNLQLYTAATVHSSKLSGHSCANLHNVLRVERCKNGTIKHILKNTGIGTENQINVKYSPFPIRLDAYKKVRKVNHNSQITKFLNQRMKTNVLQSKPRNFHQDATKLSTVKNGNRIFKQRPQISQSMIRFISSRSSILPPPSTGNSKNIDIVINSDEIPSYKINVKFNGTIPPPTSRNENLIHSQRKELTESSFNITMSKGRKVRPPSGTERRCMSSGRILKESAIRKFNDFSLLKNKESLQKSLRCFIHTTQPLRGENKSNTDINLNNITKSIDESKPNEIYYKQHFPNQSFSCLKKNRHFIKSYLRPVNLPPPTPKKLKVQTSNSLLPPVYSLEVMKDLSPTSIKQETKSPLLDLLVQTKGVDEKEHLENNLLPLNLNFATSGQNVFGNEDDPKKAIYVKMQGNTFRSDPYNSLSEDKVAQSDMMDSQMTNSSWRPQLFGSGSNEKTSFGSSTADDEDYTVEIEKSKLNKKPAKYYNTNNDDDNNEDRVNFGGNTSGEEEDYTVDIERNKLNRKSGNYNSNINSSNSSNDTSAMNLKTAMDILNKNNSVSTEEPENNVYTEFSNKNNAFPVNSNSDLFNNEEKQENKLNSQATSIYDNYTKSLPKSDDTIQIKIYAPEPGAHSTLSAQVMNRNNYHENQENKDNFQTSNINNDLTIERHGNQEDKINFQPFSNMSTERSDSIHKAIENKINYLTSSMNNMSIEKNDSSIDKMDENQLNKENFQSFSNMNNTMSSDRSDSNMHGITDENKVNFQLSNVDNSSSTENKMDEIQENKVNFQPFSNMNNAMSERNDSNLQGIDENKVNFQLSNINNSFPTENKIDETQENRVNFQPFSNMNNALSAERSDNNLHRTIENKINYVTSNMNNMLSTESNDSNVHKIDENQQNKVNYEVFGMNNMMSTAAMNNNNSMSNYNNDTSKIKESSDETYYKTMNYINSDIPETVNNNLTGYSRSDTYGNKVNMQASSGNNTMNSNLTKPEDNQYFEEISKCDMNAYNNDANQMSSNMYTNMTNQSPIDLLNKPKKTEVRKSEGGLMKSLQFMRRSRGLAELAKSFNHASMFIPKQNLWKKFKFPAPSSSSYYQSNNDLSKTMEDSKIPKFNNFVEARSYFAQPQNLKKLTPAQIAMYNSILHYENVIKKHSDEIKRQKNNLESIQHAIKVRKNKYYKNKSNFDD